MAMRDPGVARNCGCELFQAQAHLVEDDDGGRYVGDAHEGPPRLRRRRSSREAYAPCFPW